MGLTINISKQYRFLYLIVGGFAAYNKIQKITCFDGYIS